MGPPRMGNQTELGREHYVVAAVFECPTDQFFVDVGTVDLGGVDQGHAKVDGAVNGADGLGVVTTGPV